MGESNLLFSCSLDERTFLETYVEEKDNIEIVGEAATYPEDFVLEMGIGWLTYNFVCSAQHQDIFPSTSRTV